MSLQKLSNLHALKKLNLVLQRTELIDNKELGIDNGLGWVNLVLTIRNADSIGSYPIHLWI